MSPFVGVLLALGQLGLMVRQLRDAKEIAKADFIHRLSRDFFTTENRLLFFWIQNDLLRFIEPKKEGETAFFEVDRTAAMKAGPKALIEKQLKAGAEFSDLELDDFLGHFEDIGGFLKNERIVIGDVYDFFSYYVEWSGGRTRPELFEMATKPARLR